ncbi:MAG TPA: MBG domain-containing protein, partial [Marmoricola sp.]|nr:MBG domain-containing protein [Marmoricola sp.]
TPDNQTITYGANAPVFTYAVTGLLNGDTLVAQPTCTVAGAHSNAGTYTITCSGADAGGNYTLDQSATATLKVNKAQLTVMANDVTRPYGVANPVLTATVGGFVAGDTAATAYSGAALVTTTAGVSSTVGTYPITAAIGTLASTNYSFAFASGTLTIVSARTTINELQVSATKTLLTGTIKFKATLVSSETGAPVVGRVVTFSFSAPYGVPGVTQCRATTDAGGVAECTTPLTLAALIEALSLKSWAVFAGDANFLGSSIQRSNQL